EIGPDLKTACRIGYHEKESRPVKNTIKKWPSSMKTKRRKWTNSGDCMQKKLFGSD
ncbi:unnamed protein product, partial [Caenorhabditis brenneri]